MSEQAVAGSGRPTLGNPASIRPIRGLHGKVAIVTGAGTLTDERGNGGAIATLLAEDGATVLCVDRDKDLAMRTVSLLKDEGLRAFASCADVTIEADCDRVVQEAVDQFGRVDILINNVGVLGPPGTAETTDVGAWARGLELNVTSMMLMAKHAVPAMLRNEPKPHERGIRGSIVNMGSVAGLRGGTPSLLYPTSKGAVVNMTRAMAAHHGSRGIRVNCVCMVYSPMVSTAGEGMSAEMREARRKRSLLQTEGNVWDCAAAVRFLAGGEARWITGTILTVDAGATCVTSIAWPEEAS
ncbi:hypothetical protein HIM_06839 [Hirsutella minnesotensis 3608]|uniref:Uncharacterized protein n=1 Tax=Hirsutella minnesotensis 3608 TaxID=1043627 RepID=A0A0F7ZII1_9HYPO|nr:hypothetical protein HIM_06839 [Hirsutella minnesotensis 3608]